MALNFLLLKRAKLWRGIRRGLRKIPSLYSLLLSKSTLIISISKTTSLAKWFITWLRISRNKCQFDCATFHSKVVDEITNDEHVLDDLNADDVEHDLVDFEVVVIRVWIALQKFLQSPGLSWRSFYIEFEVKLEQILLRDQFQYLVFDELADFPFRPGKKFTLTVKKTSLCKDGWIGVTRKNFWPWKTLMGFHGISVSNPCVDVANCVVARDGVDGVIFDGKKTFEPMSKG